MGFTPLGDELKKIFEQNTPLQKQIGASFVVEAAIQVLKEFFGEEAEKFAKPLFLKNRTLTISCLNSVMAQELRLRQLDVVEAINKKIGKNEVDRIRYLA